MKLSEAMKLLEDNPSQHTFFRVVPRLQCHWMRHGPKLLRALEVSASVGLWGAPKSCDGCKYEKSTNKQETCHECEALATLATMCQRAIAAAEEVEGL